MVAEVYAGINAFKTMFDLAKGLKDIHDATLRNAAVIELQEKILSAQAEQSNLLERLHDLEKENINLKNWEEERQRYQLEKLPPGVHVYSLKQEMAEGEPLHYICQTCYQRGKKSAFIYFTTLVYIWYSSPLFQEAAMSIADDPIFHDAEAAREWLEALLWPDGPVCPHCGVIGAAYRLRGKKQRAGLYKCKGCEEQFTVTVGTIFERSHIPLNKWVLAFQLMVASKKGMSAHQLHRMLGLTYKTAWFMAHRIRAALVDSPFSAMLGGQNKVVEIDETFIGGKEPNKHKSKRMPGRQGGAGKAAVVALVERDGAVRSHHIANVDSDNLKPVLQAHIDKRTYLMTDESPVYPPITKDFNGHGSVNHSIEEYVRGVFWHTNTAENYFSILKRGIYGVYHHVSEAHLHRYLGEFDFRYSHRAALGVEDDQRMAKAAKGIVGKRLTYRRTRRPEEAETGAQAQTPEGEAPAART